MSSLFISLDQHLNPLKKVFSLITHFPIIMFSLFSSSQMTLSMSKLSIILQVGPSFITSIHMRRINSFMILKGSFGMMLFCFMNVRQYDKVYTGWEGWVGSCLLPLLAMRWSRCFIQNRSKGSWMWLLLALSMQWYLGVMESNNGRSNTTRPSWNGFQRHHSAITRF